MSDRQAAERVLPDDLVSRTKGNSAPDNLPVHRRLSKRAGRQLSLLSIGAAALMLLTVLNGVAFGASTSSNPHYGLKVSNLVANPQTQGVIQPGQTAHFYGNITGGLLYNYTICSYGPTSPGCLNGFSNLSQPGWHLYWFFGTMNDTGNVTNVTAVQQHLLVPSTCLPPSSPFPGGPKPAGCAVTKAFQQNHTYARVGNYVVSLTAYDGNFDWVIATAEVTVVASDFRVKINSIQSTSTPNGTASPVEGFPVRFNGACLNKTNLPTNCTNVVLVWNFGDGSTGYGSIAYHSYTARGTYVVTLTGVDSTSGAMNRTFSTVYVSNLAPFGDVTSTSGSLIGPRDGSGYGNHFLQEFYGYNPASPFQAWNTSTTLTTPIYGPWQFKGLFNVTVGTSFDVCALAFDFNPAAAPGILFQWHFGDGAVTYSRVITPYQIPQFIPCEANSWTYPGAMISGSAPRPTLSPEFSDASHVYECPGWYNITLEIIDQEGLNSNSTPYRITIHAVPLQNPTSGIPTYSAPVGQVSLLNASQIPGFPQSSAFYNYTWSAGRLGTTYGTVGRISSFKPMSQAVTLTTTANTSALPCCSSTPVVTHTTATFTKVRPTAGIDSLYTEASITVTISNPYYYNNLNFTLLENGHNEGWYNMSYYTDYNTVTFQPIDFQMANAWQVLLNYTPYGQSGGTYVNIEWNWQYDDTSTDNYDATEAPDASDTTSVWFSNSNTTRQNSVPVSVNTAAQGEPFTMYAVFFSPAQTNLTETWTMGDGTVYHTHDTPPRTPEPTMSTWYLSYAYNTGSNYGLSLKACDDWGYCGWDNFTVDQTTSFQATDTAPFIELPSSSTTTVEGSINTVQATVFNQDNASGAATVQWSWGDGQYSYNSTNNADGDILYGVHIYRYAAKYAVVATATSASGSSSVNWTWINVELAPSFAKFSVVTPSSYVYEPVWFSGANSSDSVAGAVGMSFGWIFGNHQWAGGVGIPGMLVSTTYSSTGTYHVTLVTQSQEGVTAGQTQSVTIGTIPITSPYPTIPNTLVTADQFFAMRGNVSGTSFGGVPLLNVTWKWGDGSPVSYGLSSGHSYLYPGVYYVHANFTAPGMGVYMASSRVIVYDGVPTISLPFSFAFLYGQSSKLPSGFVPTNLSVGVLGDYADQGKQWNYTWNFGDASSWLNATGGNTTHTSHQYNYTGPLYLTVNVSGPYHALGAPSAVVADRMMGLPVSSEDGLPNIVAQAIVHVSPFSPEPGVPFGQFYGTGCTNYVGGGCEFVPGIGSFNGDNDGDGLTNIQEIMGTVTGFYSNPLDNQTAGDGLADSSHTFSSSFQSSSDVYFSYANGSYAPAAQDQIPGVAYYGPEPAFNTSKLDIQVNNTGSLSALALTLSDPEGQTFSLPTLTSNTTMITLISATPDGGPAGGLTNQGLTVSDFSNPGTWTLSVTDTGGGSGPGTVVLASIAVTYWGDPGHADPLHQGMLQGRSLTVPIFNCSEISSSSLMPVFNPGSFHAYNLSYFPYSESYYKLSVLQGVPYARGSSGALLSTWNTPSACTAAGLPQGYWSATATYLGDADFGISPWNAHAAGDPSLTNGMKALGAASYDTTAGKYVTMGNQTQSDLGGPYNGNVSITYPVDHMTTYYGPLNPTALSTAGDGMADSSAPDPVAPLGLEVTIKSALDTNCYVLASLVGGPEDIASVTLLTASGQNEPTIYTPARLNANNPSANCDGLNYGLGTVYFGTQNYNFSFASSYFFPLDNTQSTFTLQYNLWQNETLTAAPPRATVTVTGNLKAGAYANATGNIWAIAQVVPLQRLPVVMVNTSSEIANLTGYGLRFEGQQKFDSFDLNFGSGGSIPYPFKPGVNIILESALSVTRSSANTTLFSNAASLSTLSGCGPLISSTVSSPQAGGSSRASLGLTVVGDVSSSRSCGSSLLAELLPANGTGVIHGNQFVRLNSTALELLGLSPSAVILAPFVAPSGFNSPAGTPPSNVMSQLSAAVVNALNAIAGAIIAFANFLSSLPSLLEAFGEAVLGALSAAAHAIQAAASALLNALNVLLKFLIALIGTVFSAIVNPFLSAMNRIGGQLLLDVLSIAYWMGAIPSQAVFNDLYANASANYLYDPPPDPSILGFTASTSDLFAIAGIVADTFAAISAFDSGVEWTMIATSDGAWIPIGDGVIPASEPAVSKAIIKAVLYQLVTGGTTAVINELSIYSDATSGSQSALSTDLSLAGLASGTANAVASTLTNGATLYNELTLFKNKGVLISAAVGTALGILSIITAALGFVFASNPIVQMVLGAIAMIFAVVGYLLVDSFQAQAEFLLNEDRATGLVGVSSDVVGFLAGLGSLLNGAANYH